VGLDEDEGAVGVGLRVAVVTLEVSAVESELPPPHAEISSVSASVATKGAANVRKLKEKGVLGATVETLPGVVPRS
jgi:hypothetical protein